MKIVIFPCGRYEAHRIRAERQERVIDRSDRSFIICNVPRRKDRFVRVRTFFYGDSEVPVEEHDEGYCAQQWNRGDVGMHKGCLYRTGGLYWGKVA